MGWRYRFSRYRKRLRWGGRVLLVMALLDGGYIWGMMPDWHYYARGPVTKSSFIQDYEIRRLGEADLPALRWTPVPIARISDALIHAVIVAEDSRFYQHKGIDTDAVRSAMEYNLSHHRFVYGGSTISQQMIKNMLLSPSRNPLRKWHELWLTLALEHHLGKNRILEIYLNVAEFGTGVYGVEAAAHHYWGRPAARLSLTQAIELAATLSSPSRDNPATRTEYFLRQCAKIRRNMGLQT